MKNAIVHIFGRGFPGLSTYLIPYREKDSLEFCLEVGALIRRQEQRDDPSKPSVRRIEIEFPEEKNR